MQRIDTPTVVTPIPAADPLGTPGFFDKGDPTVPRAATDLSQDWCNAVQEEIVGVILGASIALDKADNGQLLAAIQAIVASVANPTGITDTYIGATAPAGWVFAAGRTIGNATSGATERANADTEALFTLLWDDWADAQAPVSTGRGASAAADFAANKTIVVPDARGRAIIGKDDMGGTAASRMTIAGSGVDGLTLGATGGAETVTQTIATMANHDHNYDKPTTVGEGKFPGDTVVAHDVFNSTNSQFVGGDGAMNNTQPGIVMPVIVKL